MHCDAVIYGKGGVGYENVEIHHTATSAVHALSGLPVVDDFAARQSTAAQLSRTTIQTIQ